MGEKQTLCRSCVLTGVITLLSGRNGFVGLLVPTIARYLRLGLDSKSIMGSLAGFCFPANPMSV